MVNIVLIRKQFLSFEWRTHSPRILFLNQLSQPPRGVCKWQIIKLMTKHFLHVIAFMVGVPLIDVRKPRITPLKSTPPTYW